MPLEFLVCFGRFLFSGQSSLGGVGDQRVVTLPAAGAVELALPLQRAALATFVELADVLGVVLHATVIVESSQRRLELQKRLALRALNAATEL